MKIVIIRHGDPDYSIDSLTEKGWKEAECLAEKVAQMNVKAFYCSPLGRAKDTASLTLKKMNRTAEECQWLREFKPKIRRPDMEERKIAWDWLPQDWMTQECFYQMDAWMHHPIMEEAGVPEEYAWVTGELDRLLASYGYVREGMWYRVNESNNDTIVFFCHFGLECVLLSHLLNISPMQLWHGTCAAPTSVTTVYTEERRPGIASMRMASFGDVSHLYVKGEPPAFSARFCECYSNTEERHD